MNHMIPTSEEEAAELIRAHARVGVPLAISGGDTRSGFGNAVPASARLARHVERLRIGRG